MAATDGPKAFGDFHDAANSIVGDSKFPSAKSIGFSVDPAAPKEKACCQPYLSGIEADGKSGMSASFKVPLDCLRKGWLGKLTWKAGACPGRTASIVSEHGNAECAAGIDSGAAVWSYSRSDATFRFSAEGKAEGLKGHPMTLIGSLVGTQKWDFGGSVKYDPVRSGILDYAYGARTDCCGLGVTYDAKDGWRVSGTKALFGEWKSAAVFDYAPRKSASSVTLGVRSHEKTCDVTWQLRVKASAEGLQRKGPITGGFSFGKKYNGWSTTIGFTFTPDACPIHPGIRLSYES